MTPWSTRVFCPWDSPGKDTGMGCKFLLQDIFLTNGSNLGLPYHRQILYHLSHQGSPITLNEADPTSPFWRRSALGFLWKEWCWSWNSSTLATSCEELTHCKRLWCWEGLGAGGEGDDRGWDGWMASLTQWSLSELRELVMDRKVWRAEIHGVAELDKTERLNWIAKIRILEFQWPDNTVKVYFVLIQWFSFWTVVMEKILESPLDCKEIQQSILKEINSEYSLEGLMLKLELQYFGHLIRRTDSL